MDFWMQAWAMKPAIALKSGISPLDARQSRCLELEVDLRVGAVPLSRTLHDLAAIFVFASPMLTTAHRGCGFTICPPVSKSVLPGGSICKP